MDTPCVDHGDFQDKQGYGLTKIAGKTQRSHRVAYAAKLGVPLSSIVGIIVRHRCNRPQCINPNHLVGGSQADNMRDMVDAGRSLAGADNPNAVLTQTIVDSIRERYTFRCKVNGGTPLALEFGISKQAVCDIVNGRRW